MKAFLVLEDGTVFEGTHIGAEKEVISEIVFNTSVVGYLEELTDPSYAGQAVCMTYPLIGNYGICRDDMESSGVWPDALLVRELSRIPSNFRNDCTIQQFLEENGIPGIAGIDTRALTRRLRDKGTMNGLITTNADFEIAKVQERLKEYRVSKAVERVTCGAAYEAEPVTDIAQNGPLAGTVKFDKNAYESGVREQAPTLLKHLSGSGLTVAVLDLGVKKSIVRALTARGCRVTVYPAYTTAEELIAAKPDGILVSNGPGNPKECTSIIEEIKKLCATEIPIFAIGLGHQLVALANGADTCKMKLGNRGGNHPVRDVVTGKVYITAQNHGYVVDPDSLNPAVAVSAFVNVNDGTNEGIAYKNKKILTVQFYPGTDNGPQDAGCLYERFVGMMKGENYNA